MSFLSRKRTDLSEQGVDAGRVPPGQYITERFPVLHAGVTPRVDLSKWDFQIKGLVETPVTFSYQDILNMPQVRQTLDIHCVTKWSKLDTEWEGVAVTELMSRVKLAPNVTHVLVMAEQGFTANLPLADFNRAPNLFAHRFGGEPLEPDHGWPLRLATAPLLLEVSEVGAGTPVSGSRRTGLLGTQRLSHVRRPLARTALLGRLTKAGGS
jgi:DMSO/TMAO reductase YedYZ molybdopterin-dependent catalytic subunit